MGKILAVCISEKKGSQKINIKEGVANRKLWS